MKLNLDKVATMYSAVIGGETYKYGWYRSGRAFIALYDKLLSFAGAYSELVPKCSFNPYDFFYANGKKYKKTIDGIVRFLIEKYNGD